MSILVIYVYIFFLSDVEMAPELAPLFNALVVSPSTGYTIDDDDMDGPDVSMEACCDETPHSFHLMSPPESPTPSESPSTDIDDDVFLPNLPDSESRTDTTNLEENKSKSPQSIRGLLTTLQAI